MRKKKLKTKNENKFVSLFVILIIYPLGKKCP